LALLNGKAGLDRFAFFSTGISMTGVTGNVRTVAITKPPAIAELISIHHCVKGAPQNDLSSKEIQFYAILRQRYPSGVGAVSGLFRLPVPRHEFVDAIDLVIKQALKDPCERPCCTG
tara:strand:- start:424 stop:774 length:351 start_codon:yes stop_codon:yes gene_type:complete